VWLLLKETTKERKQTADRGQKTEDIKKTSEDIRRLKFVSFVSFVSFVWIVPNRLFCQSSWAEWKAILGSIFGS
jgi:hypothetical protein